MRGRMSPRDLSADPGPSESGGAPRDAGQLPGPEGSGVGERRPSGPWWLRPDGTALVEGSGVLVRRPHRLAERWIDGVADGGSQPVHEISRGLLGGPGLGAHDGEIS